MNVSEYTPLYGLLFNFEYQTGIDGKKLSVNEMFEHYPGQLLSDYQIEELDFFDLTSLQKALSDKYFTPDNVIPYLRGLFDNYRENGGNPFVWLGATFQSVNLNPQNYRKDLITYIEKALIEWIEIFDKQPIDYLFLNSNPESFYEFNNEKRNIQIDNPKQENSIETKIEQQFSIKKSQIESEIKHPFSIPENFELFKYLDKWFKPENKAKYTYIFDFIKDKEKLEPTLNEKLFFEYIAKLKPKLNLRTFRPQPTATNEKKRELIEILYQKYLKQTTN